MQLGTNPDIAAPFQQKKPDRIIRKENAEGLYNSIDSLLTAHRTPPGLAESALNSEYIPDDFAMAQPHEQYRILEGLIDEVAKYYGRNLHHHSRLKNLLDQASFPIKNPT